MFDDRSLVVTRPLKEARGSKADAEALMKKQLCADLRHLFSGGVA